MDTNKIKIQKPSRFKNFLKAYYYNLEPILYIITFGALIVYSLYSFIALCMGKFIHVIICILLWVAFKTYSDGNY